MEYNLEDFTESNYRQLLRAAKRSYQFISFPDFDNDGRTILWRHDVDMSIQRAFRLAQIEQEEGVRATYFILLHSPFYNALEADNFKLIQKILEMGHYLGLHFAPSFCTTRPMLEVLTQERDILQSFFHNNVSAFSFHNPDVDGDWLRYDDDFLAGMVNTYGKSLKQNYTYCSDSNGYWRFSRLQDVLDKAEHKKLHILTHPEWWTPEILTPRERVSRCIDGRAARLHHAYDNALKELGRQNVR